MDSDYVICVATPPEGDILGARGLRVLVTGIGPVNAAVALTRELARRPQAKGVLCCGVGGAYPASGLAVGDVACARTECYADLGVEAPQGFLDMEALGYPIVASDPPLYNLLPLDLFPATLCVPFVTCTTCTGTDETARTLEARTGGCVESMEGAAIVHTAHLHGITAGEIRGISNMVGRRDREKWRIREAARAAQETLLQWLAG